MRIFLSAAALLAAAMFLPVSPAAAQSRLALVIGNNAYENAPALKTTVADATSVAQTLQAAGYDVTGLANLTKDSIAADFTPFLQKIQAAGPDAVVFVYFAGYAAQMNGDNYLVPVDAQINSPDACPPRLWRSRTLSATWRLCRLRPASS